MLIKWVTIFLSDDENYLRVLGERGTDQHRFEKYFALVCQINLSWTTIENLRFFSNITSENVFLNLIVVVMSLLNKKKIFLSKSMIDHDLFDFTKWIVN